jgi:hypothetical protein
VKTQRLTKPIGIALYPADIAALDAISKRYRMGKSALIRLLIQREFLRLELAGTTGDQTGEHGNERPSA